MSGGPVVAGVSRCLGGKMNNKCCLLLSTSTHTHTNAGATTLYHSMSVLHWHVSAL